MCEIGTYFVSWREERIVGPFHLHWGSYSTLSEFVRSAWNAPGFTRPSAKGVNTLTTLKWFLDSLKISFVKLQSCHANVRQKFLVEGRAVTFIFPLAAKAIESTINPPKRVANAYSLFYSDRFAALKAQSKNWNVKRKFIFTRPRLQFVCHWRCQANWSRMESFEWIHQAGKERRDYDQSFQSLFYFFRLTKLKLVKLKLNMTLKRQISLKNWLSVKRLPFPYSACPIVKVLLVGIWARSRSLSSLNSPSLKLSADAVCSFLSTWRELRNLLLLAMPN